MLIKTKKIIFQEKIFVCHVKNNEKSLNIQQECVLEYFITKTFVVRRDGVGWGVLKQVL
jgi:hypothetical protein